MQCTKDLGGCRLCSWWLWGLGLILFLVVYLGHFNQPLFLAINPWHIILSDRAWGLINSISYSRYFILPGLLLIIGFSFNRQYLLQVILVITLFYIVFYGLKIIVGEARPFVVLTKDSFFWLSTSKESLSTAYKSFPSGHTGNMAIFAFSLSRMFFQNKRFMQFVMLLLVIVVALARICTGWHWPLDVLASSLIAYLIVRIVFAYKSSCCNN